MKKFIAKNRKAVFSLGFLGVLTLGLAAGIVLVQQRQIFNKQASEGSCSDKFTVDSCNSTCSPAKGKNKTSYQCAWQNKNNKCGESSKSCVVKKEEPGPIPTPVGDIPLTCKSILAQINPSSCRNTRSGYSDGTIVCANDKGSMVYCCPSGEKMVKNSVDTSVPPDGEIDPPYYVCGTN